MFLGTNLQYLRKQYGGMTQEKLAQQLGVSRQTVSKWESGEAIPEIGNLMELAEIFSCKLDDLLRTDLSALPASSVRLVTVAAFRYVQYIIISANARRDVLDHMENWAKRNGLSNREESIHWGFPYVSAEQKRRFGLQGHAAACILPDGFAAEDIRSQDEATYAVMTSCAEAGENLLPSDQMYLQIMEYLADSNVPKSAAEGYLPCFEREYQKAGMYYKDVFVLCEAADTKETMDLLNKE